MIPPQLLLDKIVIERDTITGTDAVGHSTHVLRDLAVVPASVQEHEGREVNTATIGQLALSDCTIYANENPYEITERDWLRDLPTGRRFNILFVKHMPGRTHIEFACRRLVTTA